MICCCQFIQFQFYFTLTAHNTTYFLGSFQICFPCSCRLLCSGNLVRYTEIIIIYIAACCLSCIVENCKLAAHEMGQFITELYSFTELFPLFSVKAIVKTYCVFVTAILISCKIKFFFQVYNILSTIHTCLYGWLIFFCCLIARSIHHHQFCPRIFLFHSNITIIIGECCQSCHITGFHITDIHLNGTCAGRSIGSLGQRIPCI